MIVLTVQWHMECDDPTPDVDTIARNLRADLVGLVADPDLRPVRVDLNVCRHEGRTVTVGASHRWDDPTHQPITLGAVICRLFGHLWTPRNYGAYCKRCGAFLHPH